jgi:hypothetical protein
MVQPDLLIKNEAHRGYPPGMHGCSRDTEQADNKRENGHKADGSAQKAFLCQ